jgi:hypothetical protein
MKYTRISIQDGTLTMIKNWSLVLPGLSNKLKTHTHKIIKQGRIVNLAPAPEKVRCQHSVSVNQRWDID